MAEREQDVIEVGPKCCHCPFFCEHGRDFCAHDVVRGRHVDPYSEPPSWCPLRTRTTVVRLRTREGA